jgi:hypothetical protein
LNVDKIIRRVREPFEDWTTDRNALCQHCAPKQFDLGDIKTESKQDEKQEEDTSENPLPNEIAGRNPDRRPGSHETEIINCSANQKQGRHRSPGGHPEHRPRHRRRSSPVGDHVAQPP